MFSGSDLEQLDAAGIERAEAERQLALLRNPPAPIRLDRPATVGDGITQLDDGSTQSREQAARAAADGSRVTFFVPASGAASRMFQELLQALDATDSQSKAAIERFWAESERFPFQQAIATVRAATGDPRRQLETLLREPGGGLAGQPKGLLPFHREAGVELTAVEEHIREAAALSSRPRSAVRLHFTVAREHRARFERMIGERGPALESELGRSLAITFSEQSPATDTLVVDLDNRPLRDELGRLVTRPGGHGSLLRNLGELGADLIAIKNIDNVPTGAHREHITQWRLQLLGHLVEIEARLHGALRRLDAAAGDDAPADVLADARSIADELGVDLPGTDTETLRQRLMRPLRVCSVVVNEGEPGGGPFWVRDRNGRVSLQIVESAQVDRDDGEQVAITQRATHFNPVDLLCSVRDHRGRPFDLQRYVDPATSFVTEKSKAGRRLRALEHPGLWNGSMARWITVFVEVPASTFQPVKTVWDLLRPEHQSREATSGAQ